jgi:hypothetical protein
MHVNSKEAHLAGRLHKEIVAGSRVEGFAGGGKKAGGKSRAGHKSRRTERNDYAEDSSLLRDIDTAFGLLPRGGAYKVSNFYYDDDPYMHCSHDFPHAGIGYY